MGDSLAGAIFRGWVRSASGDAAEGIPGLEQGIRDLRTTGTALGLPYYLALKAKSIISRGSYLRGS
jgi:hypothetical protein